MPHVDEGALHALLDGEVDAAERSRIEDHLRACEPCRLRLSAARDTIAAADALLASASPAADSGPPAFEAIVARARNAPRARESGARFPLGPRVVLPLAWAASLALAAGLGWTIRDVNAPRDGRVAREDPREAGSMPAGSERAAPSAPARDADEKPGAAVPAGAPASSPRAVERAPSAAPTGPRATPLPPSLAQAPRAEVAERQPLVAPAAPAANVEPGAPPTTLPLAVPHPVAAPPPPAGRPIDVAGLTTVPSAVDASSKLAPTTPFGGTAAREPVPGGRAEAAPAAAAAAEGTLFDGKVVTEQLRSRPAAALFRARSADGTIIWRTVPRTEAAALSGMALYGIDAPERIATRVSADNRAVQTLYRLDSGEVLELLQQELPETAVESRRSPRQASPAGQGAADSTWTTVRGGVEITIRGTATPEVFATRLRLD